jgi:hypothetical protein
MLRTKAPFAIGCTNWAIEILFAGRKTMAGIPAAAQYAESAADVSPVEAHPTPSNGLPSLLNLFTCETNTVIPRSLNDPVWLIPQCFTHKSVMFNTCKFQTLHDSVPHDMTPVRKLSVSS